MSVVVKIKKCINSFRCSYVERCVKKECVEIKKIIKDYHLSNIRPIAGYDKITIRIINKLYYRYLGATRVICGVMCGSTKSYHKYKMLRRELSLYFAYDIIKREVDPRLKYKVFSEIYSSNIEKIEKNLMRLDNNSNNENILKTDHALACEVIGEVYSLLYIFTADHDFVRYIKSYAEQFKKGKNKFERESWKNIAYAYLIEEFVKRKISINQCTLLLQEVWNASVIEKKVKKIRRALKEDPGLLKYADGMYKNKDFISIVEEIYKKISRNTSKDKIDDRIKQQTINVMYDIYNEVQMYKNSENEDLMIYDRINYYNYFANK